MNMYLQNGPDTFENYGWLLTCYRLTNKKEEWQKVIEVLAWESQIWIRSYDSRISISPELLPAKINGFEPESSQMYALSLHRKFCRGSYFFSELQRLPNEEAAALALHMVAFTMPQTLPNPSQPD